jgi:hypothetical protein
VDPKHVEEAGFLWKAMYDWKLAVPMSLLVAMPLWMTGNLPIFDERLELSLITILAGTVISKEVAPLFKNWKKGALEAKNGQLADVRRELESAQAAGSDGGGVKRAAKKSFLPATVGGTSSAASKLRGSTMASTSVAASRW